MPRRARLELPGYPLHIVQRGVNRGAVFIDDEDHQHYLALLSNLAASHNVAVHAYVLMGNHAHLLMSSEKPGAISTVMRRLGQCYAQAFNQKYCRTGPLWEGRFKSCLVEPDRYLLTVYRYIELNPVRAALAEAPEWHRWSSVHGNLGLASDPLLSPHPVFLGLGADAISRGQRYRQCLIKGVAPSDLRTIRDYLSQERALGGRQFQVMVENTLGHSAGLRLRGRPTRRDRT